MKARDLKSSRNAMWLFAALVLLFPSKGLTEPLPLPERAIPLDCRLVNVVLNAGSSNSPKEDFWTIVEFEGRMDLSEVIDFSAAQTNYLDGYDSVDATGVADIASSEGLIRIMNRVRVFKSDGTNEYFIGHPYFNIKAVAFSGIGLGVQHESRAEYNNSVMYEKPICHLIP